MNWQDEHNNAKDYLKQVRLLDIKIDQRIREKESLRDRAMSVSAVRTDGDKVQSSANRETFERLITKVADMESEIDNMIDRFVDLKHKVIGEIQSLEDHRYVEVLYLKYIEYMRLEEVSCTMKKTNGDSYSYEHIRWLHGEALKEFGKIL